MNPPLPDRELQTTSIQERRHLDRSLVSGFAWTAAAKWGVQAVSWISLIILARLLSASDFGLLGMTAVFLGLAGTISECGMDGAIILAPEFPESKAGQLNTVAAALGLCGCTAGLIASPILAGFFRSAQLKQILPVMSVGLILSSLKVVPQVLLLRELRFRSVSVAEAAQGLAQSLITVFLAWRGLGYWALVFGGLSGAAVGLSVVLVLRPCGFAWPDWRHLRHDLNFGGQLLLSRVAWYLYSNSDFVVAGRLLGASALGIYTLAWNIANVPVEKVTALLSRVTPSIFSKVQADSAEIRRYLRLLTEGLCFVIVPPGHRNRPRLRRSDRRPLRRPLARRGHSPLPARLVRRRALSDGSAVPVLERDRGNPLRRAPDVPVPDPPSSFIRLRIQVGRRRHRRGMAVCVSAGFDPACLPDPAPSRNVPWRVPGRDTSRGDGVRAHGPGRVDPAPPVPRPCKRLREAGGAGARRRSDLFRGAAALFPGARHPLYAHRNAVAPGSPGMNPREPARIP